LEAFIKSCDETTHLLQVNLSRASELIKSFKHISADRSMEKPRQINVKKYLEEIIFSLKPELKKHTIDIQIEGPEELLIVSWPSAIFQLITIFIMNSLQHAFEPFEKGVILLQVEKRND